MWHVRAVEKGYWSVAGLSETGGHVFDRLVNHFSTRGQMIPTTLLDTCPPPDFRPSFGPVLEGKEERRDVRRDNGL